MAVIKVTIERLMTTVVDVEVPNGVAERAAEGMKLQPPEAILGTVQTPYWAHSELTIGTVELIMDGEPV